MDASHLHVGYCCKHDPFQPFTLSGRPEDTWVVLGLQESWGRLH